MSTVNNTNLMTSVQIKKQLKSINTDKPDIKNSLLNLVEQFQCLDHIAKSTGLIKEGFSFVNRVSWETILSKLEKPEKESSPEEIKINDAVERYSESSNQLENELIPELRKWRNEWMIRVVLIEFVFFALLSLAVAGITHLQGLWSLSNISISFQPLFYERPVFSLLTGTLLIVSFITIHFSLRNFVARQIAGKLNKETSEFNLAGAFLKNTRIQHSIFRPDIIGWGWLSRKCLIKNNNAE